MFDTRTINARLLEAPIAALPSASCFAAAEVLSDEVFAATFDGQSAFGFQMRWGSAFAVHRSTVRAVRAREAGGWALTPNAVLTLYPRALPTAGSMVKTAVH